MPGAAAAQRIDERLGGSSKDGQSAEKHKVNKQEKLSLATQPPAQQTVPRFKQTVNLSATEGQKHGITMVCSPLEV